MSPSELHQPDHAPSHASDGLPVSGPRAGTRRHRVKHRHALGQSRSRPPCSVVTTLTTGACLLATPFAQVSANGQVNAVIHQVNQDGAGPYTFEVSPTGQGGDWVDMTVQQNGQSIVRSASLAFARTYRLTRFLILCL